MTLFNHYNLIEIKIQKGTCNMSKNYYVKIA